MNDVGVHDFPSFDAALGDLCPDGVSISGVDTLGVAGIDISSVSGLSSIMYITPLDVHPPNNKLGMKVEEQRLQ